MTAAKTGSQASAGSSLLTAGTMPGGAAAPTSTEDYPIPSVWRAYADPSRPPAYLPGRDSTVLAPCGVSWDAVVMPFTLGLSVLDMLRLPMTAGYRVVGDYTRKEVIVLVHPGTGHLCADTVARVLTRGSYLLIPASGEKSGTTSAVWLSPPTGAEPLASSAQLRAALRGLAR